MDLDDLELDDDSLISFVYCEYSCSSTNRSGVWVVVVDIAICMISVCTVSIDENTIFRS